MSMYAVFQLSGLQYTAEEGAVLKVPFQHADKGSKIDIIEVLLVRDDDQAMIGTPFVENVKIEAEVLENGRSDKKLIHKYKKRTKYHRTQGHRQRYSEIKINKIVVPSD